MADFFSKSKHDLSIISPVSGDTIGFICDRVEGKPAYAEYDGKSFVDIFSTSPTQTSTNPEEELVLGSETHHAGFGKEYYDSGDRKRYFESIGMDLSYEGQAIAGWGSTGIALTSAAVTTPTIVNADFELDSDWTTSSGTWGQSGTYFRSGSKSWKCTNGSGTQYVYQNLTVFATGAEYTVTVWARNNNEGSRSVKIGIHDGVTGTEGTPVTLTSTWQQCTHTKTLSVLATTLRITLYIHNGGGNDDMYFAHKCRKAGFQQWAHFDYFCSHYKTVDLLQMLRLNQMAVAEAQGKKIIVDKKALFERAKVKWEKSKKK